MFLRRIHSSSLLSELGNLSKRLFLITAAFAACTLSTGCAGDPDSSRFFTATPGRVIVKLKLTEASPDIYTSTQTNQPNVHIVASNQTVNIPSSVQKIFEKIRANVKPLFTEQPDVYQSEYDAIRTESKKSSTTVAIQTDPSYSVSTLISEFEKDPNVEYVEPDYLITTDDLGFDPHSIEAALTPTLSSATISGVANDPFYSSLGSWGQNYLDLWGLFRVKANLAWDRLPSSLTQVTVAVLDSGVDYTHPDLKENIAVNSKEIPENGIDDDGNGLIDDYLGWNFVNNNNDPMDLNGHGTHVAGTIAAVKNNEKGIVGVAPFVKILPIQGLNKDGQGYSSDLALGLIYAASRGAQVINNSWGGKGVSQTLNDAFLKAKKMGAISVAAAGNDGSLADDHIPAYLPSVITVGAITPTDSRAYYSNYGSHVDVSAPGGGTDSIISTMSDESVLALADPTRKVAPGYYRLKGTSMAAPHVSGVVALIKAANPSYGFEKILSLLRSTANPLDTDQYLGTGAVDANSALEKVVSSNSSLSSTFPMAHLTKAMLNSQKTWELQGIAQGPPGSNYFIEVALGNNPISALWSPVTSGKANDSLATSLPILLGKLPNNYLASGQYILRLTVTDLSGRKDVDFNLIENQNTGSSPSPQLAISCPNSATAGGTVTCNATGKEAIFNEWYVNATSYSPCKNKSSCTWNTIPEGKHLVTAAGLDAQGRVIYSNLVNITVTAAPQLVISCPISATAGSTVTCTATGNGIISGDWYVNGNIYSLCSNNPSCSWSNVPAGDYSISAIGMDSSHNKISSNSILIKIR